MTALLTSFAAEHTQSLLMTSNLLLIHCC